MEQHPLLPPEKDDTPPAKSQVVSSVVKLTVEAPPDQCLTVEVEARSPDGKLLERRSLVFGAALSPAQTLPASGSLALVWQRLKAVQWPLVVIWLSLAIYALTRFIALDSFPIYFFTDEAVQTVLASDLLRDRLQNYDHEILPAFFENGAQYNLGTSVYWQVLPTLFFGKSIWVARGAAALATLAAAVAVAAILRRFFRNPYPWLGVLFLTITPAWFLHSRTAFETGLATTCYSLFLYFYLRYRLDQPRYLYAAVLFGALTFYSYNPARVVILVTALLLLLTDASYHWQHRRMLLGGFGLALLLTVPFVRFLMNHPTESTWQMRLLGSYWTSDVSLWEKLRLYAAQYARGLDPFYWYVPHADDLARHTMKDYGHLLKHTLPLGLFGIGLAFYNFRAPAYRVLLVAVLAAPSGAAMVEIGITRVLFMVIPMALLTALATSWLIEWITRQRKMARAWLTVPTFLILTAVSFYMLNDALLSGPFWYSEYGLPGMQYGARQVFGEVKSYLRQNPNVRLNVSPTWSNGTDVVARFFFDDPLPFDMVNADAYYNEARPLDENTVFVLTPEEYEAIPRQKFSQVKLEKTLPYPDNRPGFYFVRLTYAENIAAILESEALARQQLVEEPLDLNGQQVLIRHTHQDIGELIHLFDNDPGTLFRSQAINPLRVQIVFPQPVTLERVSLLVGGVPTIASATIWEDGQTESLTFTKELGQEPNPRTLTLDFGASRNVKEIWIELRNAADGPNGHVHLWDITLR